MLNEWETYNPSGSQRILVTKELPGDRWLEVLKESNYKIGVCASKSIVSKSELLEKIGTDCSGVIGQLTEQWDNELFHALQKAGGKVYCNYAVGYDNVDVDAATEKGIAVGNTPGVLTETTAEMAVALTLSCARRIVESDKFTREDRYKGWLPDLFLGKRLKGQTVGVIGAGRIGSTYALIMARGFGANLIYFDKRRNRKLENEIGHFSDSLTIERANLLEHLLRKADVVSLHTLFNESTYHLIGTQQLSFMKDNSILINTSRGPVINEEALAKHCQENKHFKAGIDVFEDEPLVNAGLKKLHNVILTPHIASASRWTRESMALLASLNIKGIIEGYPLWEKESTIPFTETPIPKAVPNIVNPKSLDFS
jgi:hydroxypyruvate reductase 1